MAKESATQVEVKITGLYGLALQRIRQCRPTSGGIIRFPHVFAKLCGCFSIPKSECWNVLVTLRDLGFIQIVPYHGIKVVEEAQHVGT